MAEGAWRGAAADRSCRGMEVSVCTWNLPQYFPNHENNSNSNEASNHFLSPPEEAPLMQSCFCKAFQLLVEQDLSLGGAVRALTGPLALDRQSSSHKERVVMGTVIPAAVPRGFPSNVMVLQKEYS